MSLKKFEAYGFKSFADKTDIIFEDGITCIVGPNGCGKSNVSDAIRWVLGEQSAKLLRGKNMQDLIFSGTTERKSMSYCEASLHFDNSKRIFPLDYDDVVISRKLYRSGESEYYLNKQMTRLKTITDLLRDVGLGREGYSIVGQGRMDAILNSKPEDRRAIFEEAIGISKFRARKNEAERKLQRNSDNMSRIADALKIYGEQLESLKKQSEDAKKFLALRDELRYHEVNSYVYSYDNANAQRAKHQMKLTAIHEECDYVEAKFEAANSEYGKILGDIAEVDGEISALNRQITEIRVNIEKQSGEFNLLAEKLNVLKSSEHNLKNEISSTRKQIEVNLCAENSLREEINLFLSKQKVESAFLERKTQEFADLGRKISSSEEAKDAQQTSVLEILDGLSQSKSLSAALSGESITKRARLNEIFAEEALIADKIKDLNEEEKSALSYHEEVKASVESYQAAVSSYIESAAGLERDILTLDSELNRLNKAIYEKNARLSMLKDIAERYEGFSPTIKKLMSDINKEDLNSCVIGVVANLIKVPEAYETAISVSLGGAVQNVVTNDETDAKHIINYLKRNSLGRVTFMPLSSIKPRRPLPNDILSEAGVIGSADKLISFAGKFSNIFSSLLGGTVIVEDYDIAVALSRKYKSEYRLVTLKGELFSNTGAITGGSTERESNLLSCEREIKKTSEEIDGLNAEYIRGESQKKKNADQLSLLRANITLNEKKLLDSRLTLVKMEEKISHSNTLNASEQEFIFKLNDEKRNILNRLEEIENLISKCNDDIIILNEKQRSIIADSAVNQGFFEEYRSKRESIIEGITASKVLLAEYVLEIKNADEEVKKLNFQNRELETLVSEKETMLQSVSAAARDVEKALSLFDGDINQAQYEAFEAELNALESKKLLINQAFANCDKDRASYSAELLRLKELINKENYNLEKIDLNLSAMQERIYEDYELTYSAALKYKDEAFNNDEAKSNINRLRNAITKIGAVNVAAIESYAEIKEKFDDISIQIDDLLKAETDLNMILEDLTYEMVRRFNEGFEKINQNFGAIFKELFGGGRAQLSIESNPELDELSYGIEIEAQPPGKKLQSIMLLSGGERALTCIAILFAILRLSSMPFCVLDEIEAPLDDSNALKVASYLKKFSEETQFVLITHKKPTMEAAHNLFGVTMEERGVSKIVSVRLAEAHGMAEVK